MISASHGQVKMPVQSTGKGSSLGREPILLQGQRVVFDVEVTLSPVRVHKKVTQGHDRARHR
jgi:hypothetical protein